MQEQRAFDSTEWIAIAALVAIVCMLFVYVVAYNRPLFNSDDAALSMLAETMWQQGRLLPVGWINNNGDLMVPSGALIVAPLLRWLPNGYAAHSAASVFAVVFELASVAWLLLLLRMPRLVIVFVVAIFAAGISFNFASMVYGQTTYVWWSAGFCLGASLIVRGYSRMDVAKRAWLRELPLFTLVFAISFANPSRVGLMMVLPLYLFNRSLAWSKHKEMAQRLDILGVRDPVCLLGLVVPFALAAALYVLLAYAHVTHASYNAAALRWEGWNSVWHHISTFRGWFHFLGADVSAAERNPTGFTGISWFRWLIAIGATSYAVYAIASMAKDRDALRRALIIALLGAFLPIFALYAIFAPLAQSVEALRYFIVPMTMIFLLAAFGLRDLHLRYEKSGRVMLATGTVLLVAVAIQRFIPVSPVPESKSQVLADKLAKEHLRWGYATWWNAGRTTVLSNGVVRVSPVNLVSGLITPFGYMVSKDWYVPSAWEGGTFLILQAGEATASQLGVLRITLGEPRRVLDIASYRVLVYDYNIATKFGCGSDVMQDMPIHRGEALPVLVGIQLQRIGDDSNSLLLRARIRNDTGLTLSGRGRYPISIGVQLLRTDGTLAQRDWVHAPLSCPLAPGESIDAMIPLPVVPRGDWTARVDLVIEGVAWLQDWGQVPVSIPLKHDSMPSGSLFRMDKP